jgi:hypothetical protein
MAGPSPVAAAALAGARAAASGGFPGSSGPSNPWSASPVFEAWNQQQALTSGWAPTVYAAGAVGLPRSFEDFRSGQFSPLEPIYPVPIDVGEPPSGRPRPRRFQFPVGFNLPVGQPGTEGLKLANFQVLRDYAEVPSIPRDVIEICTTDLINLDWDIVPTDIAEKEMQGNPKARADFEKRKVEVMDFWKNPDPDNYDDFEEWFTALVEDNLVLDAVALHLVPTLGKDSGPVGSSVGSLELLDGSTIKPLLNEWGGRPKAPQPAYQQFVWGVPRIDLMDVINLGPDADIEDIKEINPMLDQLTETVDEWAADQLFYVRMKTRTWTPYGFSPLEQGLLPAAIIFARQTWQWEYFRQGSLPQVFLDPGETIANAEEARQLQEAINMLGGDLGAKHQVIVLPPGSKVMPQKDTDLTDQLDEWLAALMCMPFGLSISDLGITPKIAALASPQSSRSQAAQAQDRSVRRSTIPRAKRLKRKIFDRVIQQLMGQEDMEWSWGIVEEGESRKDQIDQATALVGKGIPISSIDEQRIAIELEPLGLPWTTVPIIATATGQVIPFPTDSDLKADPTIGSGQPNPDALAASQAVLPPAPQPVAALPAGGAAKKPGAGATKKPAATQQTQTPAKTAQSAKTAPAKKPAPSKPGTNGSGSGPASPAHAGARAAAASSPKPSERQQSSGNKAFADELSILRRYLKKGGSLGEFEPRAIGKGVYNLAMHRHPGDPDDVISLIKASSERQQRRESALSDHRAAVVAGLGALAGQLARNQIDKGDFTTGATDVLSDGYGAALAAGADHALSDLGSAGIAPDFGDAADARAAAQSSYLDGFADDIMGGDLSTSDLADRAALYAAGLTGAFEQGYVETGDDVSDDTSGAANIVWNLGDAEHCGNCLDLDGQAFTADDLPGFPGDGYFGGDDGMCEGGPRCACFLTFEDQGDVLSQTESPSGARENALGEAPDTLAASRGKYSERLLKDFSDDQPRDDHGRWTSGGGGGDGGKEHSDVPREPGLPADHSAGMVAEHVNNGEVLHADADQAVQLAQDWGKAGEPVQLMGLDVNGKGNETLFDHSALGISRADMPQLPTDAAGQKDFIDFLAKNGVTVTQDSIDPRSLMATQNELNGAKVGQMLEGYMSGKFDVGSQTIFTSKEGDVLDGHHRWAATALYSMANPGTTIGEIRANADISRLVDLGRQYAGAHGIASQSFSATAAAGKAKGAKLTLPFATDTADGVPSQGYGLHPCPAEKPAEKTKRLTKMAKAGNAEPLIDYYNDGADGQIDWGSDGDFDQCVSVASAYMDEDQAHGFCQLRHLDATGETTSEHAASSKIVVKRRLPPELRAAGVEPGDSILDDDTAWIVKSVDGSWVELIEV